MLALIASFAFPAPWVSLALAAALGSPEPILIRAHRAWEASAGPQGEKTLNLEGDFEMRGPDWRLTADSAEVVGPVEAPERVVIKGAPARIALTDDDGEVANGEGERIVYWRQRDLVELHGEAILKHRDVSVASSVITYDVKAQRLLSAGTDGVEVVLRNEG